MFYTLNIISKTIIILLIIINIGSPLMAGDGSFNDIAFKSSQGYILGGVWAYFEIKENEALLCTFALSYLKELHDSSDYGFNWGDIGYRCLGTGLFNVSIKY